MLGAMGAGAIVGVMVSATSGLPDREKGLATGLATMTQQPRSYSSGALVVFGGLRRRTTPA